MRVRNEHQTIKHNTTDTPDLEITPVIQEEHRNEDNISAEEKPIASATLEPHEEISPELIALRDRILEVMLLEERERDYHR